MSNENQLSITCNMCNSAIIMDDYLAHLTTCFHSMETEALSSTTSSAITRFNPLEHYINIINQLPRLPFDLNSSIDYDNTSTGLDKEKHGMYYTITENKGAGDDCPICLTAPVEFRKYICHHSFCAGCSDRWFSEKTRCPLCNRDFRNGT